MRRDSLSERSYCGAFSGGNAETRPERVGAFARGSALTNRSNLPEDEVFAEGMVEDVISALTRGVNVRVLGSTSTAHLRKGARTISR
jgi:hypothetical protein